MSSLLTGLLAATLTCANPHVSDGDTLRCNGERVRLWGMDAPELHDTRCAQGGGGWACDPEARRFGPAAAERLYQLTRGSVRCAVRDSDRYGRKVAQCAGPNTPDLGRKLVLEGLARDYTRYSRGAYLGDEQRARRAGVGLWSR